MLRIENDVPEAYQPVQIVYESTDRVPRLPFFATFSDLGMQSSVDDDGFEAAVRLEEETLGIARNDPDFYMKHYGFLEECDRKLLDVLPEVTLDAVSSLAAYFSDNDDERELLAGKFQSRVDGISDIATTDPLLNSNQGDFFQLTRRIQVNGLLFLGMEAGKVSPDYIRKVVLLHEVMHSLLSSSISFDAMRRNYTDDSTFDLITRNGIDTTHTRNNEVANNRSEYGSAGHAWISESGIEEMRQKLTGSDDVGYMVGVALLRTIYDLYPETKDAVEASMFLGDSPSRAIGAIEAQLGPFFVEEIEGAFMKLVTDDVEMSDVKELALELFLSRVSDDQKAEAEQLFEDHYSSLQKSSTAKKFTEKYKSTKYK